MKAAAIKLSAPLKKGDKIKIAGGEKEVEITVDSMEIDKKPIPPKRNTKQELTERYVFKKITGKNAIWNGSETQNFTKWKKRIHSQYQKDTGKNPYYNQKLTKNFKDYLMKRFNF